MTDSQEIKSENMSFTVGNSGSKVLGKGIVKFCQNWQPNEFSNIRKCFL